MYASAPLHAPTPPLALSRLGTASATHEVGHTSKASKQSKFKFRFERNNKDQTNDQATLASSIDEHDTASTPTHCTTAHSAELHTAHTRAFKHDKALRRGKVSKGVRVGARVGITCVVAVGAVAWALLYIAVWLALAVAFVCALMDSRGKGRKQKAKRAMLNDMDFTPPTFEYVIEWPRRAWALGAWFTRVAL